MKLPYFFAVIVLCINASVIQAQTTNSAPINTVPEGITTFNIPATGASPVTSYFSAPLVNDPIYTGAVGSVVTTSSGGSGPDTVTVADSPAPWTVGQFSASAAPYFVKFLSGSETGRVLQVLSNTTSSLTLDITDNSSQKVYLNSTSFGVEPGDTFEVFAGDTLGLMFGLNTTSSPLVLTPGSIFTADTVSLFSQVANQIQTYYFDKTAGYWKQFGNTTNDNNVVIRPYGGFLITRNSNQLATSFVLTGRVAEVNHLVKAPGANSACYDSTGYPVDVRLSALKLVNWKTAPVPKPPAIPFPIAVDIIAIWDPIANQFDDYFQLADSTWRKAGAGNTDESSFTIPAATTVCFIKYASTAGSTSYVQPVLPYSLTN